MSLTIVLRSHLDVSTGVDLVNCISRGTSSLSIQVIALHKHRVITQTAHPDVSFTFALQLHAFANVEPKDRKEGDKNGKHGQKSETLQTLYITVSHLSYLETYSKYELLEWTI